MNFVGSNGRAFKYQFDLQIQKVVMKMPFVCDLQVIWRRKNSNIRTKNTIKIDNSQEQIIIGQKLSMISTCYLHTNTKQFQPKQSTISVVIIMQGASRSQKSAGYYTLDLCQVLNPSYYRECTTKTIEGILIKCPIPNSKIYLKLSGTFLQEMIHDDKSIGSGVGFSQLNTSDYSITTDQRFSQKKCLSPRKLQEIVPSKDTYSMSYGGIRYSSQRRDELKKDIIQTTTNLVTNQYDFNRYQKSKNSQDNTQVKQLIQQQNKRSKLQAQVNKLNVYINQQGKRLTQYVSQNSKLKQQLKNIKNQNQNNVIKYQKQNKQLINKNYQFNCQIRDLKLNIQLQKKNNQYINTQVIKLTQQRKNLLYDNQLLKQSIDKLKNIQKNNNQLQNQYWQLRNYQQKQKQILRKQIQNIHKQLQYQKKQNNIERQDKYKLNQQKQYIQKQLKQKYQKQFIQKDKFIKRIQNQINNLNLKIKDFQRQLNSKKIQIDQQKLFIQDLKKRNNQLQNKQKLFQIQNNNKKNQIDKLNNQIEKIKNGLLKIKDQKTAQYQQQNYNLRQQNNKIVRSMKYIQDNLDQNVIQNRRLNQNIFHATRDIDQKKRIINNMENQIKRYKNIQQKYYQLQNYQKYSKIQIQSLKQKILSLQIQLEKTNKLLTQTKQSISNVDTDTILRQNLQIQIQLKFKQDQLQRLHQIQNKYQNNKCQLQISKSNKKQLQQILQIIQKDLKQKNRAYMLQVQKIKLLTQQRNNMIKIINQNKIEIQKLKNIIYNGEAQLKQLDIINLQISQKLRNQDRYISQLHTQLNQQKNNKQIQIKISQLQLQNIEQIKSLEYANQNLLKANSDIKKLQILAQQRQQLIFKNQNICKQLENQLRTSQITKNNLHSQFYKLQNDKKALQRKIDIIMQQLHIYKKKFQDQKNRSTAIINIRSNQDFNKIKNLQNQMNKKQDKIRKLQKQIMKLEQENIQLNIKIMKQLSDLKQNPVTQTQT